MELNQISELIIGCGIRVHRVLGPGLLESAYQHCMVYELKKIGFKIEVEKPMPIVYEEIKLDHGYRIDILVEDRVVIELKTVENLAAVHTAQILTYMKLGNYKLGLLMNFNETLLKNGIKRFIN